MNTRVSMDRKGYVIKMCALLFCMVMSSVAQAAPDSPAVVYLVGQKGLLQKLDRDLNIVAIGEVPGCTGRVSVRDADISPEGDRLFLAVSGTMNPLVVVHAMDLSVEDSLEMVFPPVSEGWYTYDPTCIVAASSRYLYMTDEAYTAAPKPHSTVLIDLVAGTARPVYGLGFTSNTQAQISPNRDRMAVLRGGKVLIVDASTGNVADRISLELIGSDKMFLWFDMDWNNSIMGLYAVPVVGGYDVLDKVTIDMKDHRILDRGTRQRRSKASLGLADGAQSRRILTATRQRRYIQDREGNISIYDRGTGAFLEELDSALCAEIPGKPVVSYVSPDGKLLFYRKDATMQDSEGGASKTFHRSV